MAVNEDLRAARAAHAQGAWVEAYEAFAAADVHVPLGAADLEDWATCAYLLGRQHAYEGLMDRAHQRYLDRGDQVRGAHCACWLALSLAGVGATAQASGWFARARRLLTGVDEKTVVHGYLELASALTAVAEGRFDDAHAWGSQAIESGSQFGDLDLTALALQLLGRTQLRRARFPEGLALLDEAMVVVASGRLKPQVAGIVYCSVIDGCRDSYSLRRAQEWTAALTRWCESQPELVTFTGECRVARAEMLVLRGAWHDAVAEAERATMRPPQWSAQRVTAAASYQRAEVARLRGEFEQAEQEYAAAARLGGRVQPGMALLRLAQGQLEAAEHGLDRALDEAGDRLRRTRLLPAKVSVALAAYAHQLGEKGGESLDQAEEPGEEPSPLSTARAASAELSALAAAFGAETRNPAIETMARHAAGAVALAAGEAATASAELRAAADGWRELSAPYETARARLLLGSACLLSGDRDGAELEFSAAREAFTELGAAPDLERVTWVMAHPDAAQLAPFQPPPAAQASRSLLSPRELEVLENLVAGQTNRSIAALLTISERTVDRHVSNILDKLGVASRTEAATYAIKHDLL